MDAADRHDETTQGKRLIWSGLLFGIGLGGFFDGIVLHQILQWHHLLSSEGSFPVTTVAGLETNTLWDGLFHAATYVATMAGLALLWRATRTPHDASFSTAMYVGVLLMGWGAFNLVEGTVNHHILTIHHVREDSSNRALWDVAFLVWGAAMLVGGWLLARSAVKPRQQSRSRG